MKSVHQVPYHRRVCSFSVFVLKWSRCVQNPVNTLSSPSFPKYSCWALHSVSNNLCGSSLRGAPIYIRQRFSNCMPGNQGVGKNAGWGSKLVTTPRSKVSCTYRESIPNPRTSSPHLRRYVHTLNAPRAMRLLAHDDGEM
jgi:hypothetical protein